MSQKAQMLYEGKGKKVYNVTNDKDQVILFFKDDLTAYQGKKQGSFIGKGALCKSISSLIFRYLKQAKILTHWIKDLNDQEMLCYKTRIFPLEVVIRNRLAGSTAKRLGFKDGTQISRALLEFYYKKDILDDPFISEEQIQILNLIQDTSYLKLIKQQAYLINDMLKSFFEACDLELIDFKIEFGLFKKTLLLADDISPDSMRIWDSQTQKSLDKDRFRKDQGQVQEGYQMIKDKIYKQWNHIII